MTLPNDDFYVYNDQFCNVVHIFVRGSLLSCQFNWCFANFHPLFCSFPGKIKMTMREVMQHMFFDIMGEFIQ